MRSIDIHICGTKFGATGCPQVVDMCVGLVVVSVGKCYTTAYVAERKKRKKKKH